MTLPWGSSRFDQAAAHVVSGASVPTGTPITLTAPNDFQNAAWTMFGVSCPANNVLAPDGSSTASTLTYSGGGGNAFPRQTMSMTMTAGVIYSLTGYIKNLVAPVWMGVTITNANTLYAVAAWANGTSGAGITGTTAVTGDGVIDGWQYFAAGNGYTKLVLTLHFGTGTGSGNLVDLRFDTGNGAASGGTNLQSFNFWGWGA